MGALLNDDYVTCVVQDGIGRIQVGHRNTPLEAFDLSPDGSVAPSLTPLSFAPSANVVCAVACPNSPNVALGYYYSGALLPSAGSTSRSAKAQADLNMPSGATPPSHDELNAILARLATIRPLDERMDPRRPPVAALQDDWRTRGDWLGRYGRYWACLTAMQGSDYFWGAGFDPVEFTAYIGPHHTPGDSIRYHVTWLYSDDPRVLEIPPVYLDSRLVKSLTTPEKGRRQAEHDDHGEAYASPYYDGPHVFYDIAFPPGVFILSVYDMNKEEHNLRCPYRDFPVIVHPGPSQIQVQQGLLPSDPAIILGRINHFWEGKYTRILVRGPSSITLEINRNYSFDAIVAGIMIDSDEEEPAPYFESEKRSRFGSSEQQNELQSRIAQYASNHGDYLAQFPTALNEWDAADRLLAVLEGLRSSNPQRWANESDEDYALLLRLYSQLAATEGMGHNGALLKSLGTSYFWSALYDKWESTQALRGLRTARSIEKSLRWDGTTQAYSGFGHQTVVEALAGRQIGTIGKTTGSDSQ
jgi:hypothetical protein